MHIIRYAHPQNTCLASAQPFAARSPWTGLESEMDRWFESTLAAFAKPLEQQFPVDIHEDNANTYVRAELPGVNRDDIKVEMVEGYLTIQATRKQSEGGREESLAFSRSLSLPDGVHGDQVKAAYENGVLTVTLPKREEARPRRVTVSVN